ncbi:MAG: hypothetical protein HRT71_20770 [Flavobacteriales bacterium]|nr:hypothetical protein [Flavobacteriales bacterium]
MKKAIVFSLILLTILLVVVWISLPKGSSHRDTITYNMNRNPVLSNLLSGVARMMAEDLDENNLAGVFHLEINDKGMKTLQKCREKAIERGILTDDNQPYVKAKLTLNNTEYKVKVKLKGMMNSHWSRPIKWSFRIVLKDSTQSINGMRVFSIQLSAQRGFYVDYYYGALLNSADVLNLQYDFIKFGLNGKVFPRYCVEEFFDSPLLVRQNRPPGPIVKFVYDEYWESVDWKNQDQVVIDAAYQKNYHSAPLKSYNFKTDKYKDWNTDSKIAINKLDSFRRGELTAIEVFDLNKMGKFFAINTIMGNQHPALLTNFRFYFNPQNQLLEPIGYDMGRMNLLKNAKSGDENHWPHDSNNGLYLFSEQLFSGSTMRTSYLNQLDLLANHEKINAILKPYHEEYLKTKALYNITCPDNYYMIDENIDEIRSKLSSYN